MTVADRITRVEEECSGCWGQSHIPSWERARMNDWRHYATLTEKQEKILAEIERKAFQS